MSVSQYVQDRLHEQVLLSNSENYTATPLNEEIMSPDTRMMFGLSLILVPTIVYRGLTVRGVVTNRLMESPGPANLSPTQIALYRAGHAHAGVLTLLAMLLQIAVDYAAIPGLLVWPVRVGAIAAAVIKRNIAAPPAPAASKPGHAHRGQRFFFWFTSVIQPPFGSTTPNPNPLPRHSGSHRELSARSAIWQGHEL